MERLVRKRRQDATREILLLLLLLSVLKEEANGEAEPRALHSQAEQSGRGLGLHTGLNGTGSSVVCPAECSLLAASLPLCMLAGVNPALLSQERGFRRLGREDSMFSPFICLSVSGLRVSLTMTILATCAPDFRLKGPHMHIQITHTQNMLGF